jgi:hypothetical protein
VHHINKFVKYILILVITLLIVSCSKKNTDTGPETSAPSARSSFTKQEMVEVASFWARQDNATRAIGSALPTGSMLRTLDSTSVLMFEKITPSTQLNIGDVIGTDDQVLHRLVRYDGSWLVLRGDNNNFDDTPINRADAKWRLVGILFTNGK